MKHYEQLLDLGCFTRDEVCALTGNYDTAGSVLRNYKARGYIMQVKRNLYVAVDLADCQPVASKYQIAGRITQTSYVSHHAAFEYYGCANQVSYQVEVSSQIPFDTFAFDGITYAYLGSRIEEGIITRFGGIRITDTERTVLDGINDFEKIMGLEELLRCMGMLTSLNEDRLIEYLAAYGKQVLYQKTGYILRHFQRDMRLSEGFFVECAAHIGKSTRYLMNNGRGSYNSEWQLVAPTDLDKVTNKGVDYNADV